MWRRVYIAVYSAFMKSIQMTIDEPLLERLDEAAERLRMARSAFIRGAVERWLDDLQEAEWDRQHREAYERFPVEPDEFPEPDDSVWDDL